MWLEYLRTVTIKLSYSCRKIFQSHGASGYYTHSTYGTCIFTKYLSARLVDLHGKSKKIYHTLPKKLAALDGIPQGNFIFQGFCFRGKLLTRKASTRHTFGIGNAELCRFLKSGGHGLIFTTPPWRTLWPPNSLLFWPPLRRTFWRTWKWMDSPWLSPTVDTWQLFCSGGPPLQGWVALPVFGDPPFWWYVSIAICYPPLKGKACIPSIHFQVLQCSGSVVYRKGFLLGGSSHDL